LSRIAENARKNEMSEIALAEELAATIIVPPTVDSSQTPILMLEFMIMNCTKIFTQERQRSHSHSKSRR